MDSVRFCDKKSRGVQPAAAENYMSGAVGVVAGAIPSTPNRSPAGIGAVAKVTAAFFRQISPGF
ncbi:MAG: hypothetical protein CTY34_07090 [Methylobacter sp.]|nr:MAG: hypothetical protein CTY34_07090 [Methylobacter sp.]PPD17381.1 MAG: hypothetical protein CTY24_15025 [Methylobacter sp.]PPD32472.1 MAG: hypothetical protein CTY18_10125 [Methylomonas sp.]